MQYAVLFLVTASVFALIDMVWLKLMNQFYKAKLGDLLLKTPNLAAAVVFYVIYVVGMIIFAVDPALDQQNWIVAAGYGAMLGLVAYATYDLTNLATLKKWSRTVVLVDIVWGVFVTATASTIAYVILSAWFGL